MPPFPIFIFFEILRRGLPRDVHDGRPEEVLRRDEEDGEQEAGESHAEAEGKFTQSSDDLGPSPLTFFSL